MYDATEIEEFVAEEFESQQDVADARSFDAQSYRRAIAALGQNAANAHYRASERGAFMRKGQRARARMPKDVIPLPGVDMSAPVRELWNEQMGHPDRQRKRGKATNPFLDCSDLAEVVMTALDGCTVLDGLSRSYMNCLHPRPMRVDDLSRGGEFMAGKPNIARMVRMQRRAVAERGEVRRVG
jgi:hypothetical protein